jgi:outer membrane protein
LPSVSNPVYAGTNPTKIGFADVEYIFSQMPEAKQIETELQTLQAQLKKQYDGKVAEFQKKLQEYQQFGATVPDAVRKIQSENFNNFSRTFKSLSRTLRKIFSASKCN